MAVAVKMPDLGTTVDTVVLIKWLKQIGDQVKRGENLCEIETDKATTELESVAQGVVLKHTVSEGQEIIVGTVIAYIGQAGESVPD